MTMPARALMLSDLTAWLALDDARRSTLREVAMRLGLAGGRKWAEIPDDEVRRIYLAVFAGDDRTDAEFDKSVPF